MGWEPIIFSEEEEWGAIFSHDDLLIIHTDIFNFDVGLLLVNTGISVNVIFAKAFNKFQIPYHLLDRISTPFVSFSGNVVQLISSINLPIVISSTA